MERGRERPNKLDMHCTGTEVLLFFDTSVENGCN